LRQNKFKDFINNKEKDKAKQYTDDEIFLMSSNNQ